LILAGLALVVGVVGLVIGISSKNGNKSDHDIADATKPSSSSSSGPPPLRSRVPSRPRPPSRPG
jgi:hypothetical protein